MKFNILYKFGAAGIFMCLFSSNVFAKQVALYAEPSDKAKIVGTVDLTTGIIPIFTPKGSAWVKVADPSNGNVGWIQSKDLSADGSTSFSFSAKTITDDGQPNRSYKVIEFSNKSPQSTKEYEARMEKLQAQQEALQQSVNQSVRNMVNDMNKIYQQYWQMMNEAGIPVIMPVMMAPPNNQKKEEPKTRSVTSTLGVGTTATTQPETKKTQ